ncbi:MAG: protein kinase, partial [Candidatus Binatia bacterium]
MIGKTILHYRILEKLGEGGMGVVYKAEDQRLERTVGIKLLPRHITADEQVRKRFENEAKAAAGLNHPNIATVYAIEESDDETFIVMEYIDGQELKSAIDDRQLSIDDILNYATQIAEGLQAAHEKGIVHRDIKSSNIMISDKGLVKIMDFGLAKLAGQSKLTKTGTTMGTMAYISPEQLQGREVDQRTDIWAFGVVLYELLTAQLPFKGEYEQAVMYSILNEEPEPLDGLRPDIPPALSNVVRKALEKDPKARYHSLQDIIVDFKGAVNVGAETTKFNYGTAPALRKPAAGARDGHITTKGERRQVTILVSSLTGYDNLVENLEAEEVNEVMNAIGSKVTEIVTEREGLVNQFSEDEIVLLFGMPVTHEDDLRRAVGAALELHEFIGQLNESLSDKVENGIRVHSGVEAGLVVVQPRDGTNRQFKLTGEPTQIAARLAAEANEDEILITSNSQRLIQPFYESEPCGNSITIRGKAQPLTPFAIKGESGFSTRFEAIESETLTSFTGREKELDILKSDLQKAINGDGQFVTIVAEAGLGKSRLLYEFKNHLDGDVDIIQASCQSNARNIPYFAFVALLRDLLDIDPDNKGQNQAETVVSRILAVDPHLEVYIPLFLQLLSIDCEKYPVPDHLESDDIQQATVESICAILTMPASKKPMVIFLEDWHWVDEASQNTLKQIAEMIADFPLLLVVTCRPEVVFDWGNPANHSQIQLAPLEASDSAGIIKSILGAESVPDELATLIHERTGGNPFFVEELSQTLQEGGAIKVEDRKITLTDSKSEIHLPHTIQAVIRSRLDRLKPESLEVLRVASVIGRDFTASILEKALTEQVELDKSVKTLR